VRAHISANVGLLEVFTGGRHRSCPVVVYTVTYTDGQNDHSHNLLQCSLSFTWRRW